MKKNYIKPELFYENFTLLDAITTCTVIGGPTAPEVCAYYDEDLGFNLFIAGVSPDCEITPENYGAGSISGLVFGS